ncbi:ribonuclease H-like domain-containing protein [Tanacetum coccineum]
MVCLDVNQFLLLWNLILLPYEPTKDDPLIDSITGYQKLLGKLIYLTHTRLDIAYYVHCLAQYMHSPLKSHLNCALNVLRYLKGAPGKVQDAGEGNAHRDRPVYSYGKFRNWTICNMKTERTERFEMMKYSFNDDEEYITIKESEYLNHSKDSLDAYRELLRLIDEGWVVTTPKDE